MRKIAVPPAEFRATRVGLAPTAVVKKVIWPYGATDTELDGVHGWPAPAPRLYTALTFGATEAGQAEGSGCRALGGWQQAMSG